MRMFHILLYVPPQKTSGRPGHSPEFQADISPSRRVTMRKTNWSKSWKSNQIFSDYNIEIKAPENYPADSQEDSRNEKYNTKESSFNKITDRDKEQTQSRSNVGNQLRINGKNQNRHFRRFEDGRTRRIYYYRLKRDKPFVVEIVKTKLFVEKTVRKG